MFKVIIAVPTAIVQINLVNLLPNLVLNLVTVAGVVMAMVVMVANLVPRVDNL